MLKISVSLSRMTLILLDRRKSWQKTHTHTHENAPSHYSRCADWIGDRQSVDCRQSIACAEFLIQINFNQLPLEWMLMNGQSMCVRDGRARGELSWRKSRVNEILVQSICIRIEEWNDRHAMDYWPASMADGNYREDGTTFDHFRYDNGQSPLPKKFRAVHFTSRVVTHYAS